MNCKHCVKVKMGRMNQSMRRRTARDSAGVWGQLKVQLVPEEVGQSTAIMTAPLSRDIRDVQLSAIR